MRDVESEFQRLAAQEPRPEQETIDLLRGFVERLTTNDLLELLLATTGDGHRLEDVAAYSYEHANGFRKLTLLRAGGYYLRAHLWTAEQSVAENIHGHRWPFASRIISGSLREARFRISDDYSEPLAFEEYRYETPDPAERGVFTPLGEVRLRQVDDILHEESSTYAMGTTQLHQVFDTNLRDPAVSVIVTGRSRARWSPVYGRAGTPPVPDANNHSLAPEVARDVIAQIRDVIS